MASAFTEVALVIGMPEDTSRRELQDSKHSGISSTSISVCGAALLIASADQDCATAGHFAATMMLLPDVP